MSFDATKPTDHSPIVAVELRDQFTSLKALIDDLTTRVTALETPPLAASGFGDDTYNGEYVAAGQFNGETYYMNAAGRYLYYRPAWALGTTLGTLANDDPYDYAQGAAGPPAPSSYNWNPAGSGADPGGTIS